MICVKRKLKQRRFEQRTLIGSAIFFTLKLLDANKFEFLSVFTVVETIFPQLCAKRSQKMKKKDHFRLTCVAKKRLKLTIRSLSKAFLSEAGQPEVKFFAFFGQWFYPNFLEIVSARAKTLHSYTNSVASRNVKREMVSLPVDARASLENASA